MDFIFGIILVITLVPFGIAIESYFDQKNCEKIERESPKRKKKLKYSDPDDCGIEWL